MDRREWDRRERTGAVLPPTALPPAISGRQPRHLPAWFWAIAGFAGVLALALVVAVIVILARGTATPGPTEPPPFTATVVVLAADTVAPSPTWTSLPATSPTPAEPSPTAPPTEPPPTEPPTAPPPTVPPPTVTPPPADQLLVPAGVYLRGSTDGDVQAVLNELCPDYADSFCTRDTFADELVSPRDRSVAAFYIDRHEVTNAAYALCVGVGICAPPTTQDPNPRRTYFADPARGDDPVVYITWYNAQTYCTWRGARLPTADEWEKAARGTDGRWWPWGNAKPTYEANCRYPGQPAADPKDTTLVGGEPFPVGSFPADISPYGVMDMAGNVMEWVDADYASGRREIRGGSWNTGSYFLRAANRIGRAPGESFFDVGFRCARSAGP